MSLKLKIWLMLGLVMLALSSMLMLLNFQKIEADAQDRMHQQALDLRAALMATRRIYHKQFLASGLPLDDRTLGFLPAHAMTRIAQDFPNWTRSGVRFNNVSDRPRNPANQADADELAAMAWFRANPKAEVYSGTIRTSAGASYYHFAAPIWTEAYCLECHASPDIAPATIRQRYSSGYGYHTGDLRGVLSIRIPSDSARTTALAHWQREAAGLAALFLALFLCLGFLLNHFLTRRVLALDVASRRMAAGEYGTRLDDLGQDELGALARSFNGMAAAVEQRECDLRNSQMSYRILAEHSWNWDYWLGADGVYRYVSPACAAITGHPPEDFLADAGLMERLLHPDDLPMWQAHQTSVDMETGALPNQPEALLTLRIRAAEGGYRWIEHACVPVYDAAGVYLGRRGVNLDINERKRAEELEHFSAFQAGIAEMSTSVLHNIGNAITAVTQHADSIDHAGGELARVAALLNSNGARCLQEIDAALAGNVDGLEPLARRQCSIQQEAASAIERLSEQTLRPRARGLADSVRHIADIVRIQQSVALPSGQSSSFSLSQAIQSALDLQGDALRKRGIDISVTVAPQADLVTLPHNRLLQALVNAIRNSFESIEARRQKENFSGRLQVRADVLGPDRLRLEVADNGIGFDAATREHLFRFGYSTKQRGSGFGLHSVAMFAQEAGGSVSLDSDGPGQGARLVLELPLRSGGRNGTGESGEGQ